MGGALAPTCLELPQRIATRGIDGFEVAVNMPAKHQSARGCDHAIACLTNALARLGNDHVVIHNLPLEGRGDVDHVVVGPAGAVVIETKYLAGRIVCEGDGVWTQLKRGELRQIADPAAQAQRAADGLAHVFGRRGLPDVPVYALLVMAHPRAELDVARSAVLVVRPFELVPQLHQLVINRPRLDGARVTTAATALLDSNTTPHAHPGRGRLEE